MEQWGILFCWGCDGWVGVIGPHCTGNSFIICYTDLLALLMFINTLFPLSLSSSRCERLPCNENQECQSLPLRITYYYLTFPTNIQVPTNVFRFGPSHALPGDNILLSITHGNEDNYFNAQELNTHSGIVFVHRQITEPRDFLLNVEMKLLRHGVTNIFVAKIYIVVTAEVWWLLFGDSLECWLILFNAS